MLLLLLLLLLGFVLLIKGADWLVEGAASLAGKFGIPDLAIGLTIVAFGTSAPELVVNAYGSAQDHQGIVFGNVIGSNLFNLFAIVGIAGLIIPLGVQRSTLRMEIPISILALAVLWLLCNDQLTGAGDLPILGRFDAAVLLALFLGFLYYVYLQLRHCKQPVAPSSVSLSNTKITLMMIGGLAGLVIGGQLVVENAIDLASRYGVSESVIGLTIVAAGTSLPELATSIMAALKKNSDIAIGNVVGSNIFNIFLILSVSAFIKPLVYGTGFNDELYLLAGGSLLLMAAIFMSRKMELGRPWAAVLFLVYLGYTGWLLGGM